MAFLTDKAAKEKIKELDEQIETLELDSNSKEEKITSLEAEVISKDQTIAEQVASIAEKDEALTEANEKIESMEASLLEAQAEVIETRESVGKQVSEALAGIGQAKPLQVDANSGTDEKTTEVSRDEFNNMSPRERSEFSKNGGKIK